MPGQAREVARPPTVPSGPNPSEPRLFPPADFPIRRDWRNHPAIATSAHAGVPDLRERLTPGETVPVQDLSPPAFAHVAWKLSRAAAAPVVCVADGPRTLETLFQNLHAFAGGERLLYYPGWESLPGAGSHAGGDLAGDRLEVLQSLLAGADGPGVIATSVQAMMQRTLTPEALRGQLLTLAVGEDHDPDALAERLTTLGYDFGFEVTEKGEAVRRGGVLDLWPPDQCWPLRLEFFGEELETMRTFDPATQRSLERQERVVVAPAVDAYALGAESLAGCVLEFLPEETVLAWFCPDEIADHAELYERSMADSGSEALIVPFDTLRRDARLLRQCAAGGIRTEAGRIDFGIESCEGLAARTIHLLGPDHVEEKRRQFLEALLLDARNGWTVELWFNSEGARDRFHDATLADLPGSDAFVRRIGQVTEGFRHGAERLVVVAESDLYGVRKAVRGKYDPHAKTRKGAKPAGVRFEDWTDIHPGELVVHVEHGIGKYLGLVEIEFDGVTQEVLSVGYADGAKLHIPVAQAHLLSRYVGLGRGNPRLHKLGGRRWNREKDDAARAVQDLAAKLLETQAVRSVQPGFAYSGDTTWQKEFEATFPYQETADQDAAIEAVKADMESERPMDRLICGDVGYGKTEVAIRAAFKAVMDGKQVAILVPTTILAQQHYQGFTERLVSFPIQVDVLSRFRTRAQQQDTVRRLAAGQVDIVIGTHRLLSGDVRYKDLGLVVIDEEQRFGVGHKEQLKMLRRTVDVLTLTATPIPRTLYMSLTGARDMSVIQTAPRERQPIETVVDAWDDRVVRRAIVRELNREGQVFVLHNRVRTIDLMRTRLAELVPEARVEVGHGQMGEHQLEGIMARFVAGEFDVLLCTTIIESGVDIPNANTIIVDRADRFGLADLYQLRGRVGRYKHKAYAYLLLPPDGRLTGEAYHRIKAIQRYTALGSGFKLAMRDLEIRGAGNLLGASQSGHITNVGFDLYCQLLQRTVKQMNDGAPPPALDTHIQLDFVDLSPRRFAADSAAVIPSEYIDDEVLRIQMYRKLAGAGSEDDVRELQAELRDRFGRIPTAVLSLLKIALIRAAALRNRIDEVHTSGAQIRLRRGEAYYQPGGLFPRLRRSRTQGKLDEVLAVVREWTPAVAAAPREQPSARKFRVYKGKVVPGHRIASGDADDSPYPAGSIRMQTPRFRERGLDISHFHPATLNVSVAPNSYKLRQPDHTFRQVQWDMNTPPEDFSFAHCRINGVDALVYRPHPGTKPDHLQSPDVVEILAPYLPGLGYGSEVELELP